MLIVHNKEVPMEEILKILESDARITPEQIATMTGLSLPEVKETNRQVQDGGQLGENRAGRSLGPD